MRVAILIEIISNDYGPTRYNTVDRFSEFNEDEETLEMKIMKKYPGLGIISNCIDNVVYDKINEKRYLIISC